MSNGGSGLFNEVNSVSTMDVIEAFGIDLGLHNNKALCPFHEENHASFHVFEKNWHCFGCQAHGSNVDLLMKMEFAADALAAANLIAEKFNLQVSKTSRTKVTMASYAKFTNLPDDYLMEHFFLRETNKGVEMPYINEECEEVTYQLRRGLEKRAEGKKDKRFEFKAKAKTILYGLWNIEKTKQQDHVLLVEGASDVQVCWYNQVPCLGAPGANGFKDEWASLISSFSEIDIIEEPGTAGEGFVHRVSAALRKVEYKGRVKVIKLSEKDPRALWLKVGEGFRAELEAEVSKASLVDLYPPISQTKDLITEVQDLIVRHVFFKNVGLSLLIALWVLASYVYDIFSYFGYLWVNSPTKGAGKSLLLDVLRYIAKNASSRMSNTTESVIFRLASEGRTLILDELETLRTQDREKYGAIMSVLNNGFSKDGTVPRTERGEGGFHVVDYPVYGPKILAGINRMVDTVEDRSFRIRMVKKTPEEKIERLKTRSKHLKAYGELRGRLLLWAEKRKAVLEELYDKSEDAITLEGFEDRFRDISEPLVTVAAFADAEAANGSDLLTLPALIKVLIEMGQRKGLTGHNEVVGAFIVVAEEILNGGDEFFINSADLLDVVTHAEGLPGIGSMKGLATFLDQFDLVPVQNPAGDKRGYWLTADWIKETRARYLPPYTPPKQPSEPSEDQAGSGNENNSSMCQNPSEPSEDPDTSDTFDTS